MAESSSSLHTAAADDSALPTACSPQTLTKLDRSDIFTSMLLPCTPEMRAYSLRTPLATPLLKTTLFASEMEVEEEPPKKETTLELLARQAVLIAKMKGVIERIEKNLAGGERKNELEGRGASEV